MCSSGLQYLCIISSLISRNKNKCILKRQNTFYWKTASWPYAYTDELVPLFLILIVPFIYNICDWLKMAKNSLTPPIKRWNQFPFLLNMDWPVTALTCKDSGSDTVWISRSGCKLCKVPPLFIGTPLWIPAESACSSASHPCQDISWIPPSDPKPHERIAQSSPVWMLHLQYCDIQSEQIILNH